MSNNEFYNPYHFVPLSENTAQRNTGNDLNYDAVNAGNTQIRHDATLNGLHTGVFIVKAKTCSPLVIGKQQISYADKPSDIEPFDLAGKPAIPGSSLRGMISAVTEAISDSPFRVMTDKSFSARSNPQKQALSAIGMIEKNEKGGYSLIPLKLPTISCKVINGEACFNLGKNWQVAFGEDTKWTDCLGIFIGDYEYIKSNNSAIGFENKKSEYKLLESIKTRHNLHDAYSVHKIESSGLNTQLSSTLKVKIPFVSDGGGSNRPPFNAPLTQKKSPTKNKSHTKNESHTNNEKFALLRGQNYQNDIIKVDDSACTKLTKNVLEGLLYVPDTPENKRFESKRYEWFVPYNEEILKTRNRLHIAKSVIDNWNAMARERFETDPNLPYRPLGLHGHDGSCSRDIQPGDLMYFDIDNKGYVSKLSYSQIWREHLGNASEYIKDYQSFGQRTAPVANVSPAEALFGAVEIVEGITQQKAIASRVQFSNGVLAGDLTMADIKQLNHGQGIVLDFLASPKAPSPAMYFNVSNQSQKSVPTKSYMAEVKNNEDEKLIPSGWKRYLPHPAKLDKHAQVFNTQVKDADKKHSRVWPVPANETFYFKVEFENLTDAELNLLRLSLQPASDKLGKTKFVHRLGMGKPLGLGMLELSVAAMFRSDAKNKYSVQSLTQWQAKSQSPHTWAAFFPEILQQQQNNNLTSYASDNVQWQNNMAMVNADNLQILIKLGSPEFLHKGVGVQYPTAKAGDKDVFKWFVENEKTKSQGLASYRLGGDGRIPPLKFNGK